MTVTILAWKRLAAVRDGTEVSLMFLGSWGLKQNDITDSTLPCLCTVSDRPQAACSTGKVKDVFLHPVINTHTHSPWMPCQPLVNVSNLPVQTLPATDDGEKDCVFIYPTVLSLLSGVYNRIPVKFRIGGFGNHLDPLWWSKNSLSLSPHSAPTYFSFKTLKWFVQCLKRKILYSRHWLTRIKYFALPVTCQLMNTGGFDFSDVNLVSRRWAQN